MKLSVEGKFRLAVKTALLAGLAASVQSVSYAQEAAAAAPAADEADLGAIEVTGSRLRRVDVETASPVYTIDRAAIESSGVTTLGELIQEMPSISGAATNPQVNNGGGDGAATVSLRGLGSERTLSLLNGRRLGPSFDINSIPINLIERVEVLKEGAGAIYGSDAVGGVVNFITRKDYQGMDIAYQYGEASEGDGQNQSVELTWGMSGEKGSISLGMNYNKQKKISAANRDFSKNALYIYNYYGTDTITVLGSSRNPRGRISLPTAQFETVTNGSATHPGQYDCISDAREAQLLAEGKGIPSTIGVTRIPGQAGSAQAQYRCYAGADAYDYQPFNLIVTPQERGSFFSSATYNVSDKVEAFADMFHNFTKSGFQIAPLPFDARSDNIVVSADSIYNPFGIDFGGAPPTPSSPVNPNFLSRFVTNGNRFSQVETTTDQITSGLRGSIPETSWNWDLGLTYQRINQYNNVSGYVLQNNLQNALGPSFIDANGTADVSDDVARCGAPGAVIQNCTPINIFNTEDPETVRLLSLMSSGYDNRQSQTTKIAELSFNGNLAELKAGTALGAIGFQYREDNLRVDVDELTQAAPPTYSNCLLSSETCSGDTAGNDDVWEVYGETFVPLLADMPGVKALNLTLGLRYSDYDSFGTTTNGTAKLEYRPISDLLVRASYAEVFRAPTIGDRFSAPAQSNPLFFDPCVKLTAADVTANPNLAAACVNVPLDGSFAGAPTQQVNQLIQSNANLDPETGEVVTFGFVYDPSWLPNFSTTIDFWHYKIDDAIIAPDVNTIAKTCAATGDADLCSLITRYSDGQINVILSPTLNSASFTTEGVDLGFKYQLPKTPFGKFKAGIDATYTDKFEYSILPDSPKIDAAGRYDSQFGNYAKWRATAFLNWSRNGAEAQWTTRYIDGVVITDSIGDGSARPEASSRIAVGSVTYHDVAAGYTYGPTNTKLLLGIENVFDKQPPIFYQYALNANTNVETYDAIGRFMYVRISQSF